jgi:hypothetical protein
MQAFTQLLFKSKYPIEQLVQYEVFRQVLQ